MTYSEINACITDRFERWGRFLRREGATPVLIVGLKVRDRRLTVSTVEDLSNEQIAEILMGVLVSLKAGAVEDG